MPLLRSDTVGDKMLRFGCGTGVAALIATGIFLAGDVGKAGILGLGGGVLACGWLAVRVGNAFVERLVRAIGWLP